MDLPFLEELFQKQVDKKQPIQGVMHFAALKAVNESVFKPILYYENNVGGSINLFKIMEKFEDCKNFIFSSSASVYGDRD